MIVSMEVLQNVRNMSETDKSGAAIAKRMLPAGSKFDLTQNLIFSVLSS